MERVGLAAVHAAAVLILVAAPVGTAAQRVEVAAFIGGAQAMPSTVGRDACAGSYQPLSCTAVESRGAGIAIAGRAGISIGQRFGIDLWVQRTTSSDSRWMSYTYPTVGDIPIGRFDVLTRVIALQAYVRIPYDTVLEVIAAIGPGWMATGRHEAGAIAPSLALRGYVSRAIAIELRGNAGIPLWDDHWASLPTLWGGSIGLVWLVRQ